MKRSNFALRLQPSLLDELRKAAEAEGVALNQLINVAVANVAVAEKVSALRTEDYFRQRASRADRAETLAILEKAGKANSPVQGDKLPGNVRFNSRQKNTGKKPAVNSRLQARDPFAVWIEAMGCGNSALRPTCAPKREYQEQISLKR